MFFNVILNPDSCLFKLQLEKVNPLPFLKIYFHCLVKFEVLNKSGIKSPFAHLHGELSMILQGDPEPQLWSRTALGHWQTAGRDRCVYYELSGRLLLLHNRSRWTRGDARVVRAQLTQVSGRDSGFWLKTLFFPLMCFIWRSCLWTSPRGLNWSSCALVEIGQIDKDGF